MIRQFVLSIIFIFSVYKGFSAPSGDQRKNFEDSFNAYVTSELILKNYDRTRLYLLKIIDDSEKAGYWDICLGALSLLANVSDMNYHHEVMKEAVEKGQLILQAKSAILDSLDPNYAIRGEMIVMIGSFYAKNGEVEKATGIFQSLIQRMNEIPIPDKAAIFNAYAYIADLYMNLGLYEKVYPYYLLMEKSIPGGADHDLFSYLHLQYLGTYFYRKKNYHLAKSYLTTALKKINFRILTDEWKYYIISNYDILALIYQSLNQPDSAMMYLKRSLAMQDPDDPQITETYENYGDCLSKFHDFEGALSYYQKIYKMLNKGTSINAFKKAQILSKIGETYYYLGNYSEAIYIIQQAFVNLYNDSSFLTNPEKNPEISMIQADKILVRLLIVKSTALFKLADQGYNKERQLKSSLATFRLATLVIDQFRHKISTDDFKELFVTDIRSMYESAIKASFLAYETIRNDSIMDLAFYFMGKSKNQVLLDAIKTNYARNFSNIPNALIASENQYKNKLVELQNIIYKLKFNDADSQKLNQCQYEYAKTQNNYEAFLRGIENKYPDYYNLKYNNEVPTLNDIKQLIHKSIFIEYIVGDDYIGLIAFTKKKSVFKLIQVDTVFYDHLNSLLIDLGSSNTLDNAFDINSFKDFVNKAGSLYSILLKPVLDEFDRSDQLIIIPDDKLCFLPFDVLINKYPENLQVVDYKSLSYVLKNHIIRYEFSATLLYENRGHNSKGKIKSTYLGFAPTYIQKEGLRTANVLGRETSVFLTPLKFSSREVGAAASIFKGNAYIGENANATNFKETCLSAKIIHFAGHTFINDSIPELSGLFFSEMSDNGIAGTYSEKDVIYINEIFNLNLNSGLIILSACETGKGKLLKGEGLISIGRAFKYAGCQSLIMSLWKINDLSTSEVIIRFCQNLKKGQRTDAALRNAKLEYIKNSQNYGGTHPFLWSAFIMIGDNEPLFNKKYTLLITSGLMLILILVLYWYQKRRNFRI